MQNAIDRQKTASTLLSGRGGRKALIGLDGFVDELVHVVDVRHTAESYTKLATLSALGERISRAAGLSTNIELTGLIQKLGGNGPILANALAGLGVDVTCIGALGKDAVHPVFAQMSERCRLLSIADPGLSICLEFDDGKLIMGKHEPLRAITWEALKEQFGLQELANMLSPASLDLLGLENWTMLPHMSDIFRGMIDEVFPRIPAGECIAFFDLADPEKRPVEDLAGALALIRGFSARYRAVLGVNLKEALQVARALGIDLPDAKSPSTDDGLEAVTAAIGRALGIYCFVVHTLYGAGGYCDGNYHYAPGYYTPHPAITTGAGDNFNAGFCLGLLGNLEVSQALLVGNASSGYYVRTAKSATLPELAGFLSDTQPILL